MSKFARLVENKYSRKRNEPLNELEDFRAVRQWFLGSRNDGYFTFFGNLTSEHLVSKPLQDTRWGANNCSEPQCECMREEAELIKCLHFMPISSNARANLKSSDNMP